MDSSARDERPKQRWRFELGRSPRDCKVFLNDEEWFNVISLKIEAGIGTDGQPKMTRLTFEVFPHEVIVDIMPDVQGDLDHGRFRARRAAGDVDRSL